MKLATLVNSDAALKKITAHELPIGTAYSLSKVIDETGPVLKMFDEKRTQLLQELGTEMGGDKYQIPAENIEAFNIATTALLDEEIDLIFTKIPMEKLEAGQVKLTATDVYSLQWLLEIEA